MRAIDTALEHLVASGSKTVIVDILARDKGTLKILPSGKYESHSVLLYKDPAVSDVYIIDPNNSKYSWHIANSEVQLLVRAKGFARIVAYDKILQIYTPAEDTGPAPGQYRDCIDISVKLAFGFNLSSKSVDIGNLAIHPVVVAISNNETIDMAYAGNVLPVRAKQSSHFGAVSAFKAIEDLVSKKMTIIEKIASHADIRIGFYDEVLDASKDLTNTSHPLASLESIKLSKNSALARYQTISGELGAAKVEHTAILSVADDAGCISQFEAFDLRLTGMIESLFDVMDS